MVDDSDKYFKIISEEIASETIDNSLWARAFAEAGGDAAKTKARYILLRLSVLRKEGAKNSDSSNANSEILDIDQLRLRIDNQFRISSRANLYTSLESKPTYTDAELAIKIKEYLDKAALTRISLTSELRYAINTLGDPVSRLEYDKKLYESLFKNKDNPAPARQHIAEMNSHSTTVLIWNSKRLQIVFLAVFSLLLGLLILQFTDKKLHRESQTEANNVKLNAIDVTKTIETERIATQKSVEESNLENQKRLIENITQLEHRRINIEEEKERRRLRDQEFRQFNEINRSNFPSRKYWQCMDTQTEHGYPYNMADEKCSYLKR